VSDNGVAKSPGWSKNMSRRLLQLIGVLLLVATVGIVSCQALFAHTSGLGATQSTAKLFGR
jgi:hypothetical protein